MSLESVSTLELQKEIDECLDSHSKLLDYSKQPGTLILPAEQPTVQMEQPQPVYSWSDDARTAINDHQAYHTNMVTFLNQILVTGPPEKFPTQPKSKLKDLIMKKNKKTRKRTPEELHAYLQRNIVNVNKKINKDGTSYLGLYIFVAIWACTLWAIWACTYLLPFGLVQFGPFGLVHICCHLGLYTLGHLGLYIFVAIWACTVWAIWACTYLLPFGPLHGRQITIIM